MGLLYAEGSAPDGEVEAEGQDVLNALNNISSQNSRSFEDVGAAVATADNLRNALAVANKTPSQLAAAEKNLTAAETARALANLGDYRVLTDAEHAKLAGLNPAAQNQQIAENTAAIATLLGTLTIDQVKAAIAWANTQIPSKKFFLLHVLSQSLGIGDHGVLTHSAETLGSRVNLYNNLPPIGPGFEVDIQASDLVSLIPYREITKETHAWAMFNMMDALGVLTDMWLYASTGVGGKTIEELTFENTGHKWGWENSVDAINAAANVMPAGYEMVVPFTTWIHGEANDLTYTTYKGYLRDYHNRHMAVTGQTYPLLLDQTGKNSSLNIANELLEYALENDDAEFVMPKYWLNRLYWGSPDRLHLNANGYMLQGEYFGRAAAAKMKGEEVPNVYPESWVVSADYMTLDVTFHIPTGANLVVDTTMLPSAPALGMGFKYLPTVGHVAATSYTQNGNVISFLFPQPITTDADINFGNTLSDAGNNGGYLLPCANLRDDSPDISPTQGINMYNWCPQRKLPVTTVDGALDREIGNIWVYGDFDGSLTDFEIGLGKSTDWLLTDMNTCQVDFDCVVTTGSARVYVGDTSTTLVTGHKSVVATITSAKRLYLQGLTGGFTGTLTNVVITKLS